VGEWERGYLAEECGVGVATLWDIAESAEWNLKCVSFPINENGSSTEQIVRRSQNGKVQDAVYKWFFCKNLKKAKYFLSQFSVKLRGYSTSFQVQY